MQTLYLIYAILLGMILGSFIGMAAVRIPKRLSIIRPRSHCMSCGQSLRWYENVPLFSYLVLRGRCGHCKARISPKYFFIELITTAITVLAFFKIQPWGRFLLWELAFILPVLLLIFIDGEAMLLPDKITLPGIVLGFVVHAVDPYWNLPEVLRSHWSKSLLESFLGAFLGFITLFLLALAYRKFRGKEGLGGGDMKFAAMIGAFFGWQALFFIFFLSSITGVLFVLGGILLGKLRKDSPIPFGVFLGAATLLYFFYGPFLLNIYLNLLRFN